MELLVRNGRLPGRPDPVDIVVTGDRITGIRTADPSPAPEAATVLDAGGGLLTPPYVEPHVHLDTVLTAGEPRWNESGTLWEGIACWTERKPMLTRDDVVGRALQVLRWYAANGVLHVRSHVDVTDPSMVALRALLEVREMVREVMDLQIVAFPQEGICSFPDGERLLAEAVRLGADVVGAIPHYEDTREDGVRSVEVAVRLAAEHGLRVDVHCDEIDDEQSRFVEVLAAQALRTGLRERVTASHTTAMGSYNAAYAYKLQQLLLRSGVNLVCNPMVNLHLQGRFDDYPKRRGLTRVKEMLAAGVNVAFGHDDIMDPWFPLGTANPVQVALVGALATQLTAPAEIAECHRMITDRAAAVLGLGDRYGLAVGRPASFLVLPAADGADVLRRQVRPRYVVAHGRVVAEGPTADTMLYWPGEEPRQVDFVRDTDRAGTPAAVVLPARNPSPAAASVRAQPRMPEPGKADATRPADPITWPYGRSAAAVLGFDLDAESVVLTADPSNATRLSVMSHQAYGPLTGVPRILQLLERHELRATFFVPGYSAERYPELVRRIAGAGHEIAHHGYLHEAVRGMSPADEAAMLDRGLEALERVTGLRPTGYRAPMWETTYATAGLLLDRGFEYDSSLMDSDVPYILAEHDRPGARSLVEIPVHWALDDWEQYAYLPEVFGSGLIESPAKVLEMWSLELRAMYDDGGCFSLTNHPFLSGRSARLRTLEQLIEMMKSLEVWIATAGEVAQHVRTLGLAARSFPQPIVE
ncbi:MAG: cytosine/creatinine deaminase [Streptosporangiaceae bacterium]|nr:cytosine/creatinine deaminase [Streptosporangiaceae bacterium]